MFLIEKLLIKKHVFNFFIQDVSIYRLQRKSVIILMPPVSIHTIMIVIRSPAI